MQIARRPIVWGRMAELKSQPGRCNHFRSPAPTLRCARHRPVIAMYRGRFAPSPTGSLHFGSLVAAVGSWLFARAAGGAWIVRMEDLDRDARSRRRGRGHPGDTGCVRTRIGRARRPSKHAQRRLCGCPRPPRSGRSCLSLLVQPPRPRTVRRYPSGHVHRVAEAAAHPPGACVCTTPAIGFDDAIQGAVTQDLRREVGDFVVWRVEGGCAYQLAVVVDDAAQGINAIVRGADLLDSTPRQILLQRLLGFAQPTYAHLPLVLGADGRKLSKQEARVARRCARSAAGIARGTRRSRPSRELRTAIRPRCLHTPRIASLCIQSRAQSTSVSRLPQCGRKLADAEGTITSTFTASMQRTEQRSMSHDDTRRPGHRWHRWHRYRHLPAPGQTRPQGRNQLPR